MRPHPCSGRERGLLWKRAGRGPLRARAGERGSCPPRLGHRRPGRDPLAGGTAFFGREANPEGWFFYLASLVLFAGGAWLAGRGQPADGDGEAAPPPAETPGARRWWQHIDLWLLLILALALFFRLYRFHSMPFGTWYDEAIAGLDARRLLTDGAFWPVFWESMNHPAHHLYLFALGLQLFGDTIWGLRAVSVAFGVATVVVAYLFGRTLHGRGWGLLLAFIVATMRWDVNFSRVAMNSIDVPFFAFLTLTCGLRAWRTGLRSTWWVVATGLALGMGLCFYTGFRLFAAVFLVFALGCYWWRSRHPLSILWRGGRGVRSPSVGGLG